jgi:hypothetical protein
VHEFKIASSVPAGTPGISDAIRRPHAEVLTDPASALPAAAESANPADTTSTAIDHSTGGFSRTDPTATTATFDRLLTSATPSVLSRRPDDRPSRA